MNSNTTGVEREADDTRRGVPHGLGRSLGERYATVVRELIDEILAFSSQAIISAAQLAAGRIAEGSSIFVAGTGGHSHIAAQELFYRSGGLAPVVPLLDAGYVLDRGGRAAMEWERTVGHGGNLIESYGVEKGDVLLINNPYGVNAVTIDAALRARERQTRIIALTSPQIAASIPPDHPARHPSGFNLCELADITIDTRVPPGDAVLHLEGLPVGVASVSTTTTCFCLNWFVAETASQLMGRGISPPIWKSANLPGGDEYNRVMMAKYAPRIRHL